MYKILKEIDFIIFDLDGVFYREDEKILGTEEIINFLEKENIQYCFFTNNSNFKTKRYKEKLQKCNVNTKEKNIFTTTKLIEHYLFENDAKSIFVLGSNQLENTLYKKYTKDTKNPEYVVIGMDNNITLKNISDTINIINKNTKIIAANPDKLIPTKDGFDLECGAIITLIKKYKKNKIKIIGKPDKYGYETILEKFNKKAKNTLMVGDTYSTDIIGAKNSEINPSWIKTGNKLPKKIKEIDFLVFESLIDLKDKIKEVKR